MLKEKIISELNNKLEKEINELRQKNEERENKEKEKEQEKEKENQKIKEMEKEIEKLSEEASQAKLQLATDSFEKQEEIMRLKRIVKKYQTKLESMGVNINSIK